LAIKFSSTRPIACDGKASSGKSPNRRAMPWCAFGFYPWIDASQTSCGIVARDSRGEVGSDDPSDKPAVQSVDCGRLIRAAAWMSGQAQP